MRVGRYWRQYRPDACDPCGALRIAYNSCRNRHCPKCQTLAKERRLQARKADLLPVEYSHVVFTLPHTVNPLAQGTPGCATISSSRRPGRP